MDGRARWRGSALATPEVALPGEQWAPIAEVWGLRLGLMLVGRVARSGQRILFGDNLPVIRFASMQGRLLDPSAEGLLSTVLNRLLLRGICPGFLAVRRRFSSAADRVATSTVQWASSLPADAAEPQPMEGDGCQPGLNRD